MNRSVLLVDDNAAVRTGLKAVLIEAGYEVTEANDGLDGLTKAKNNWFDAFVIDYKMPIMDGVTLIKGLKEMPDYQRHPMVLLSTDDGAEFQNKVAAIENLDVMCKPVDHSHLLASLDRQTGVITALTA